MIEKLVAIIGALPPEAVPALGRMLGAILSGQPDKAAREARVTAETIAAKKAFRAGYARRGK